MRCAGNVPANTFDERAWISSPSAISRSFFTKLEKKMKKLRFKYFNGISCRCRIASFPLLPVVLSVAICTGFSKHEGGIAVVGVSA